MVRSLWSAATGMNAQQTNVDTISNNLANVNTTGYKAQGAQFKSLLYQELQTITTTANGAPKPTTSQVGLGVRTSTINQYFSQGSYQENANPAALAIGGDGFFKYQGATDGEVLYTRNGNFTWALSGGNGSPLVLTTAEGNPVLGDSKGTQPIYFEVVNSKTYFQLSAYSPTAFIYINLNVSAFRNRNF